MYLHVDTSDSVLEIEGQHYYIAVHKEITSVRSCLLSLCNLEMLLSESEGGVLGWSTSATLLSRVLQ